MSEAKEHVNQRSHEESRKLERALKRFEEAWQRGERPVLDDYLPAVEAGRPGVLVELVHTDLEYRLKAGEAARVEQYLERYPELAERRDQVLQLIAAEYRLRRRRESTLTPDQYAERFPGCREELAKLLAGTETSPDKSAGLSAFARAAQCTVSRVSCPHCDAAIEMLDPARIADTTCSSCGVSLKFRGPEKLEIRRRGGGSFELIERLGSGGFATVYKARDTLLDRTVAIKIPRANWFVQRDVDEFLEEARVAASLDHPGIVPVYDMGQTDDGLCYTVNPDFSVIFRGFRVASASGEWRVEKRSIGCLSLATCTRHSAAPLGCGCAALDRLEARRRSKFGSVNGGVPAVSDRLGKAFSGGGRGASFRPPPAAGPPGHQTGEYPD